MSKRVDEILILIDALTAEERTDLAIRISLQLTTVSFTLHKGSDRVRVIGIGDLPNVKLGKEV